jgi:hypothetical protein
VRTVFLNGLPHDVLSSGHAGEEENEEDREERRRRRRARKEREQAALENGEPQLEGAHQPRDAGDRGPGQQKKTPEEEFGKARGGHREPDSQQAGGQDEKDVLYKEKGDGSKERKVYNEAGLAEEDGNPGEGVRSGEDEREERERRKEEKRRRHKEKKKREKEHGAGEGGIEVAEESERNDRYRKRRNEREGSKEVPANATEAEGLGTEELRERKRHKRREGEKDERSARDEEMGEKEVVGSPERGRERDGKSKRVAEETLEGGEMVSEDIQEPGKELERASGVRRGEVKVLDSKTGAVGEDEEEGAGGDSREEDRRERKRRRKHRHRSEEGGDEEREARRERRRERKRRKYVEREGEMEGDGDQNDGERVTGRGEAQNKDEKDVEESEPVSRAWRDTQARDIDTTASVDKHDYDRSASRHARTETEPTSKDRSVVGKARVGRDSDAVDVSDRRRGQKEEPGRESRSEFEAKLRRRAERFGALEPVEKQLPRGSTIERDASEHRSERRQRGQRELTLYSAFDSDTAAADPLSGFRDLDRPEEEPPHPAEIETKEDGLRTKRKRQGGKENGTDEGGTQAGRNWNEVKFRIPGVGGRAEVIDGAGQNGAAKRRVIGRPAEVRHLSIPRIGAFCPGPETAAAFRQQIVGIALCWHASILACRLPFFVVTVPWPSIRMYTSTDGHKVEPSDV